MSESVREREERVREKERVRDTEKERVERGRPVNPHNWVLFISCILECVDSLEIAVSKTACTDTGQHQGLRSWLRLGPSAGEINTDLRVVND